MMQDMIALNVAALTRHTDADLSPRRSSAWRRRLTSLV